jgi:CheY-like chemotaxis protein
MALRDILESWGAFAEFRRSVSKLNHPADFGGRVDAIIAYHESFQSEAEFADYCREWACKNVPVVGVFNNEEDLDGLARTHVNASVLVPLRASSLLDTLCQILFQRETPSAAALPHWHDESGSHSLTGTRILVAEDNAVNRRVITAMLGKLGCKADLAATGLEAIKMWEPGTYDLILMDCQMPEMDGYEAAATIRRKEKASGAKGTRIVALTANSMYGEREKCLLAGMDDHVPKPVSLDALRRAVENCIVNHSVPST